MDEPSLWSAVARRWLLVVAVTLACAAAGLIASLALPVTYEARATLILTAVDQTTAAQVAAITNARTLFESRLLASKVIERFKLNEPPHTIHPDSFVNEHLGVAQIRDTNYLRLTLRLPTAQLASDVLNGLIADGIDLNRQLSVENTTSVARGLLKAQLDEARANLDRRALEVEQFRTSSRLELVRTDVEQVTAMRAVIAELDAAIEFERARVAEGERQLASRARVLPAPRRTEGQDALLEASRRSIEADVARPVAPAPKTPKPEPAPPEPKGEAKAKPAEPQRPEPRPRTVTPERRTEDLPSLATGDPFIDPVYEVLDYQVATGRNRLSALRAQRAELIRKGTGPLNELYIGEAKLERLKLEHELAAGLYKEVVTRYEQARENAVRQSASIQIADPATPPLGPAGPNRRLSAGVGAALGLLLSLTLVLVSALRSDHGPLPARSSTP